MVTGYEPMTGAEAYCLKPLSEQHGRPQAFADDPKKVGASTRIYALKGRRRSALRPQSGPSP